MSKNKNKYSFGLILLGIVILLLLFSYYFLAKKDTKDNTVIVQDNKETITDNKEDIIIPEKNTVINKLNLLVNEQNFDEVLPVLEKLYKDNPTKIEYVLNYANVLANVGSLKRLETKFGTQAIVSAKHALSLDENSSEAYRIIGYANEIMENYDEAFIAYNKSIELDKNNYLAISNRGHAYKLTGDLENALKDFLESYKLNSEAEHTVINLANMYLGEGDFKKALTYYNKVLDISSNTRFKAEALFSIGSIALHNNNIEESEKNFKKAIELDPDFELGYIGLARLQIHSFSKNTENMELIKLSIDNLQKALKINPNKALAYLTLSEIHFGFNEIKKTEYYLDITKKVIPFDLTLSKNEKEDMFYIINNIQVGLK